jgi:hypothetical protein
MTRFLLCAVFAVAFVTADMAESRGLQGFRVLLFTGLVGTLLFASLVEAPVVGARFKAVPVLLMGLFVLMLALPGGHLDPLGYKTALPLLVLLLAPNLAHALANCRIDELAWRLLALYVLATGLVLPAPSVHGQEHLERLDFSGSLVTHSGLCAIFVLLSFARQSSLRSDLARLLNLALAGGATLMLLLTATRTPLVTILLALILLTFTAADRLAAIRRLALWLGGAALVLSVHTLLVSDALFLRLVAPEVEDYSSGRATSQLVWLEEALRHPWGMGVGVIRERLADGRPEIDGEHLLEWPHNELVRFFVEGGVPGLAFILLLLGWLTWRACRAARHDSLAPRRALMLAITADMLAQAAFQNYFNSIYHATGMLILLVVAILQAEDEAALHGTPVVEPVPQPLAAGRPSS